MVILPTKKSSAPIQKEGTGPRVLPMMKESTAPNPKEVAGLKKMMVWWW